MNRGKNIFLPVLLCVVLALSAASCGKWGGDDAAKDSGEADVKKGVKPVADSQAAVVETDYGRIVIELYPNLAPKMVERFKQLASEGFYNGTTIHRIDPNLGIIQGGDPNSKDADPANDGAGDSPRPNVPAEFSDLPYERGIVGAARKGADINSANCQFFITLKRQPAFEQPGNRYTVFGRVIEGMNNADIISNAPVLEGTERPADKVLVKSVTLAPRANFK
ncbi:MAG: peptidylprolyl isomerase [Acidobacteria bacterium]|nr:peptidylprolyl isomerase [Acidobacteriota bacterium]MCA1642807.1 peptidylprolyl isomerase [Acidobacteriota bacterium]